MFEKIAFGIRTFLRDEQLFNTISNIEKNCPDAKMIIADDGDLYKEKSDLYLHTSNHGHVFYAFPFDSGFGAKSNFIAEQAYFSNRPYLLIASDDFEFDKKAAQGVLELQSILDYCPEVDIASGRVNNRAYEFFLDITSQPDGFRVKEIPVERSDNIRAVTTRRIGYNITSWFVDCDLTVNYSLIRMDSFRKSGVRWDDDVKIGGGEHGSWFYDCKQAGLKTVYAVGVNINEQNVRNSPHYKEFRNRANSSDRPCFDKRNIVEYILGDGRVDYRRQQ